MIAGATRGAGGAALGAHLANQEHNEEVRPGQSRGLTATDIRSQIDELTRLGSHAKTSTPIYHVHADPPADRPWSAQDRARYWGLFEREFGLEGRPFASVIHVKEGREHEHRAYLRIRPDGTAIRLDHDHARREKISRVMEFERGEPLTKGAHNRAVIHALRQERPEIAQAMEAASLHEGRRPRASTTPKERMQEERTAVRKADVAKATAMAWKSSDNPQAFMAALADKGLILARGDKVPVILDQSGNTHALGRMLSMAAKSNGEPAPRSQDVAARLAGIELPSLDDARQQAAQPVPVHDAPVIAPDPVPPNGGGQPVQVIEVPASQDVTAAPVATPSNDGQQMPAAASAPKSPKGSGGGGGGSSATTESASPLPSLDVGAGPGEPPGPNASPDEKARFAAKLADYEDRKAKAWLAWIKAWEAQAKKGNPRFSGGGSDSGIDEKELRRVASELILEIREAAERSAAIRAFNIAWTAFRNDQSPAPRAPEGPTGPLESSDHGRTGEHSDARHGRGNATAEGGGWTAGDDRNHERNRGHSDAPGLNRTALEIAAERIATDKALSLSDPSALRAAMMGPDPLAGLQGKDRKEKLDALNRELAAEFSASRRSDFAEEVARERMRSHPLARALREGGKHLPPDERAQAWADIKEAHAALIVRLKEQQKANQEAGFLQFLEFHSHTDSRALAVFEDMKAKAERARKIRAELAKGDARVAELRSSEPQGERDPDKAAQAAKTALYDRLREAQEQVKEAQKNLSEAPQPWKVTRWIAAVGFTVESVKQRASAEQALERAMTHEKAVTPHYLDIDAATGKARNAAVQTERAHSVWRAGPGAELATLEPRMAEIHAAVDRKDWRITEALATTGIDAALDEVRKREEREERRRAEEAKKAEYGARAAQRGQVVEFPAGPRMR